MLQLLSQVPLAPASLTFGPFVRKLQSAPRDTRLRSQPSAPTANGAPGPKRALLLPLRWQAPSRGNLGSRQWSAATWIMVHWRPWTWTSLPQRRRPPGCCPAPAQQVRARFDMQRRSACSARSTKRRGAAPVNHRLCLCSCLSTVLIALVVKTNRPRRHVRHQQSSARDAVEQRSGTSNHIEGPGSSIRARPAVCQKQPYVPASGIS